MASVISNALLYRHFSIKVATIAKLSVGDIGEQGSAPFSRFTNLSRARIL